MHSGGCESNTYSDAGKVGNSGDEKVCKDKTHQLPEWSAGRNQRPEEFKPEPDQPRLGICLSGGGIRSASFSLGALQAIQTSKLPIPKYITSVGRCLYGRCLAVDAVTRVERSTGGTYLSRHEKR